MCKKTERIYAYIFYVINIKICIYPPPVPRELLKSL